MKKLDRFILKAFIGPFVAILLVVIFILMMQFLWLYIDELVGKGLGLRVVLEFMFWGGCTILPIALPLATLLSSMMTIGSMAENNELMAMRAAGISLTRVMTPLAIASAIISVGAFFAGNNLVPKSYDEIFTMRDDIGKTKNEIQIPSGTFYDGIEGYILRIGDQDKKTKMLYDVMVYDHTRGQGNTSVTLADSAMIKLSSAKDYLTFTLYSGSNYQENNTRKYRDTTLELQQVKFSRQALVIPLKNYSFEQSDSSRFGDQIKAMTAGQLKHNTDSLSNSAGAGHDRNLRDFYFSAPLSMKSQLDTSFMAESRQKFSKESFGKWRSVSSEMEACTRAKESAMELINNVVTYNQSVYEYNFFLSRSRIELLKKFAQALACFILFFIGAPLGALIKKGGLGTSAIISALFFVLYWVVDISGTKLARDGAINAFHGAFVSAYVLIPIGAFLCWKAIHDAEIFNMDKIKFGFKRLWSRISLFFRPVRIVYMGTPEFAVESLDNLIHHRYNVVGVVTVADKPSGRGLKMNESAVKQYAAAHGIPVLQPIKLKDPEFLESLKALKADLFVVVAFRMLPEEVWKMPRLGTFNLHAALLPQYRGAAPINWAVINGEKLTGVTTFMIDKDIDTGGIILREDHRIGPEDTAGDVHDALMVKGSELVLRTVEGIIQNNIELRTQRSYVQGSEVLKTAPKISRELCHIDWSDTASNIHNLIRGLSPYPTAYTELVSEGGEPQQLKIFKAVVSDMEFPDATPGQIISDGKTYLCIKASDKAIELRDIQLSGKKRMNVEDFLRGFHNPGQFHCSEGTSKSEIEKTRQS